jgi:hypothetical protein
MALPSIWQWRGSGEKGRDKGIISAEEISA